MFNNSERGTSVTKRLKLSAPSIRWDESDRTWFENSNIPAFQDSDDELYI